MSQIQELAPSPDISQDVIFPPSDLYSDEPPWETELHLRQIILLLKSLEVEGVNNKLKLLKRCGFGFRNFNNFTIRALLLWHYPNSLAQ